MRENQLTVQNQILSLLKSEELNEKQADHFTAAWLAQKLNYSRNFISQLLNDLIDQRLCVKINTRPVYYFSRERLLHQGYAIPETLSVFTSWQQLNMYKLRKENDVFDRLVGRNGSLSYAIEQAKAAITYPPQGLPMLLTGATGTGKSYLARLMYQYACQQGTLSKDSPFVTINCAEYADNPELFLTHLFGYKKGAYTGADSDRQGFLAAADGGVLFLDEVHALKPECQEKIFLFLDQGIYHMIGDNETWYSSHVRVLMATTENPQEILLKTLLRRIPIHVQLPDLEHRPLSEKRELIVTLFHKEQKKLDCTVLISDLAYHTLESVHYSGNVGELENAVKVSVANAFLRRKAQSLEIHIHDLPAGLTSAITYDLLQCSDQTLHPLHAVVPQICNVSSYEVFNHALLHSFHSYKQRQMSFDSFLAVAYTKLETYADTLIQDRWITPQQEILRNLSSLILTLSVSHSPRRQLSNNSIKILARYLADAARQRQQEFSLNAEEKESAEAFLQLILQRYPLEARQIRKILDLAVNTLSFTSTLLPTLDLFIFMQYFSRDLQRASIPVVILAHGYAVASGMAEVGNQLLRTQMFDAIDMPADCRFDDVTARLNEYIDSLEGCLELIVLVDMGSLENISDALGTQRTMNIGILSNVSTKLMLDIGSMIMEGTRSLKEILKEARLRSVHHYEILENQQKPNAIVAVCSTGIATAEKVLALFQNSLPASVKVELIPVDYSSLNQGRITSLTAQYHILLIVGTLDASVAGIPFVSVEELIDQKNMDALDQCLKGILSQDQLHVFKRKIIKNFSMENLMNYLTILNPNRILIYVEEILDQIQEKRQCSFSGRTIIGLYLHISCLIERLVIGKAPAQYPDLETFTYSQTDFIRTVQDSFASVCKAYNIVLPVSEIGYLYDYIEQGSVAENPDSVAVRGQPDFFAED